VETGSFERLADFTEQAAAIGIGLPNQQAIDRIHPKADTFHVKRGNGPAERFRRLDELAVIGINRQGSQLREQFVEFRESRGSLL
jgi:hypothetical protein